MQWWGKYNQIHTPIILRCGPQAPEIYLTTIILVYLTDKLEIQYYSQRQ
jgi:hypothetical protein